MTTTDIAVRSRTDNVGDALRWASHFRKERTVRDALILYSKQNDDPALPLNKRMLWHLDPTLLRSAVSQTQTRLRVHRPARCLFEKDGTEVVIEPEVPEGEFRKLLGTKLFPSAPKDGKGKTGKVATWCEGIEPIPDDEQEPDGLSNPIIVSLINLAKAAGDMDFAHGKAVREIARMPYNTRKLVIKEKADDYDRMIRANGVIAERNHQIEQRDREILRLTDSNRILQGRVDALEDWKTGMDQLKDRMEAFIKSGVQQAA